MYITPPYSDICATRHKVLWGTAPALQGAYGDPATGPTESTFISLPEIVWSGLHHIWGRPTAIYYHRPLLYAQRGRGASFSMLSMRSNEPPRALHLQAQAV